jgi:hypothetical protein
VWEFLKTIPKWGDTRSEEPKERGRIEQIKARLDGAVEHILRLVAVFIVENRPAAAAVRRIAGKLLGTVLLPRPARS